MHWLKSNLSQRHKALIVSFSSEYHHLHFSQCLLVKSFQYLSISSTHQLASNSISTSLLSLKHHGDTISVIPELHIAKRMLSLICWSSCRRSHIPVLIHFVCFKWSHYSVALLFYSIILCWVFSCN